MENDKLSMIFSKVGTKHGFEDVSANFVRFRDFKVKWTRNYKWASFEVSDYLDDAPEHIIESLANTIFDKIMGEDGSYSDDVCSWLTRDEFVRSKQPVYVSRFFGLSETMQGNIQDLERSYRRLIESQLIDDDPNVCIRWVGSPHSRSVGKSSILMKVVGISCLLDSDSVDDDVLDYCLYSQLVHISLGFNPGDRSQREEYERMLARYPKRNKMEASLKRLNMHI